MKLKGLLNGRRWLVVVAAIALLGAVAFWWRARPKKPEWNVVLITFDTTRADHLGCYGADYARTPTIDLMASQGLRFDRCFAPAPLTLPSHASILTGLYPFRHGLRDNGVGRLADEAVTLPEVLQGAGYQTGAVVGAFVLDSQFGLDQGFDFYEDDLDEAHRKSKFHFAERNAAAVTETALAWLETVKEKKFFLWAHYFDPHSPYAPPGFDPATAPRDAYDLEISFADNQLDRLLTRVGEIQHATGRPTLLVFAGDHGESLWNHGEPTHGLFLYNDTIRVPLIIADPSLRKRGVVLNQTASLVDLFPTILKRLDLPLPYKIDGQALYLTGTASEADSEDERAVYFETVLPYGSHRWSPMDGVVQGNYKLIVAPRSEFFDLAEDPLEETNLYGEADPRVKPLADQLHEIKNRMLSGPDLVTAKVDLDEDAVRRLRALGYLGGSLENDDADQQLPDPKDHIDLHRNVIEAQNAIEANEPAKAIELLTSVLERAPRNPRSLFLLIDLLDDREVRDQAEALLLVANGRDLWPPLDSYVPLNLGTKAGQDGRFADAATHLRRAVEADRNNELAYFRLALAMQRDGSPPDNFIPHLQRALELDTQNVEYAITLAMAEEQAGDFASAVQVYDQILERDGDNAVALNNSAWCLYKLEGDSDRALARAQHAARLTPESPQVHHTIACILLTQGQPADAAKHLRTALQHAPEYAVAHYHLGVALEATGDVEGAAESLKRATELADEPAAEWLSDAQERLSRLDSS